MSNKGSKVCLHVMNIIIAVIALALCCTSIWFFVQVYQLTSLRNSNHYLLDYNVYWPQAIPWLFFLVSVCVLCATFCGISGAKKSSKGLLNVYVVSFSVIVILLILTAIISLVFADSKSTDDFIKRTVWDVFGESQNNVEVADLFGKIEKKLYCCGADSPRDYKSFKSQEFPQSCCDQFHFGWNYQTFVECDFANKLANERHGCSHVASQYSKIVIRILSGVSLFVALLGIICVIVAFSLSRALRVKPRVHQYAAPSETESEKVLM